MMNREVPPVVVTQVLDQGIQGMGIRQAVISHFSPDAFQGDMANSDAGLFLDQFAQLQEVLVGPFVAVSPAGFILE